MKHFNWKHTGLLALSLAAMAGSASAQEAPRIRLNGQPFQTRTEPVTQDGRVLVPMRAIFEALGARVDFHPDDQSIVARRRGTVVRMMLGRSRASVNDQPVRLDVTPVAADGRTLVPLRFVSESLGAFVNYDADRNLVSINSQDGDGVRRFNRDRDPNDGRRDPNLDGRRDPNSDDRRDPNFNGGRDRNPNDRPDTDPNTNR